MSTWEPEVGHLEGSKVSLAVGDLNRGISYKRSVWLPMQGRRRTTINDGDHLALPRAGVDKVWTRSGH